MLVLKLVVVLALDVIVVVLTSRKWESIVEME